MSKILKIFAVLLIANLFIKNLDAATVTVRDVVNGFDTESTRYQRLFQIAEALSVKIYQICRAAVMANSFYSDRGLPEGFARFADEDLDDFTFEPTEATKTTKSASVDSRKLDDGEDDLTDSDSKKTETSTTNVSTTSSTTTMAPSPSEEPVEKGIDEEEVTTDAADEI